MSVGIEDGQTVRERETLRHSLTLRSALSTLELSIVQGQRWGRAVYGRQRRTGSSLAPFQGGQVGSILQVSFGNRGNKSRKPLSS